MIAVFKHEVRSYFHSLTAYLFGALLLLAVGVGAVLYNIQAAVSNFEFALSYLCIVLVVIVPILTMRTLAEEQKQKTDQLLYALPVSTTEVVLGKFFALMAVCLVPFALLSLYPLVFSLYGEVYLPTAYGSIAAFFVLCAALVALGMFLSSLTENQGFAAGIGIAVMLLNYFSVSLAEAVSSTALGSFVVLCVFALLLGALVRSLTGSETLAYGISLLLVAALTLVFYKNSAVFEGLLPRVMTALSLFERFNTFVNGVFDWTAIVAFGSVIVFFLFLSVQSLEKRRYH